MLRLPDVTLVCYETKAHELLARTVRDAMEKIEFGDVVIWSDRPTGIEARHILVSPNTPKIHSALVMWYSTFREVKTKFMMNMEWDAGIRSVEKWQNEFLDHDYIGALWPWHEGHRVGNGGLSIRSQKLMKYLAEHVEWFPVGHPDDDVLCRRYRNSLEGIGFTWASEELANKFSFERASPHDTFGFHGLFNFPYVLNENEFFERVKLAPKDIQARPDWAEMMKNSQMVLA